MKFDSTEGGSPAGDARSRKSAGVGSPLPSRKS